MAKSRNQARHDYLSWEEYFMAVARLTSKKSEDPTVMDQVGACIVDDDNRIVATGFSGMPRGCGDDDDIPWTRSGSDDQLSELDTKTPYVCHAEYNAIINKQSADVRGCTVYLTLFPCNECAKLLIQSGIREVVYAETRDKSHYRMSEDMLRKARVTLRHFKEKSFELMWNDAENDTVGEPQTLKRKASDLSSQGDAIATRSGKRQRSRLKET